MESERRGRGNKPSKSLTPGTFRPAPPGDTQGIVQLFAIAARAACAQPKNLAAITEALGHACGNLISPELDAARECGRMWQLFAKVAQLPKDTLRLEAGRAFCRDLDALAQRLELPPVAEWKDLPDALDEGLSDETTGDAAPRGLQDDSTPEGPTLSLQDTQAQARDIVAKPSRTGPEHSQQAAQLLARLEPHARATWLDAMVGRGVLGRTDVSLLIRYMAKGGTVHSGDTMLVEVLHKLLYALAER